MLPDSARYGPQTTRAWPGPDSIVAVFPTLVLFILALLVGGCGTLSGPSTATPATQRDALTAFALEGRFALRHEDHNYSGRLSWRHDGADNEVLLASPFGQGIARITTSASGAELTASDGKTYAAADAQTLTRELLGYALPLTELADWVRGRGVGAASAPVERDALDRPVRLRHDAWQIDFEYDTADAQALPARLFAKNANGMELRLRIDAWTDLAATVAP